MTHLHKVKYGPFIFGFHPSHLFHFDFFKPWRSFFSLSFFHSPSRPLFPFFIFHFFFFPFFSLFSLILVPPPLPLSSPTTTISLPQSNDFSRYPISFFLSFFSLFLFIYLSLSLCMCVCLFPFLPSCPWLLTFTTLTSIPTPLLLTMAPCRSHHCHPTPSSTIVFRFCNTTSHFHPTTILLISTIIYSFYLIYMLMHYYCIVYICCILIIIL